MSELAKHALLLDDLAPHVVWDDPAARDRHMEARRDGRAPADWPQELTSHVEPVHGHDEPGAGVTIHRAAPWRCRCPEAVVLALDYREVPAAWAAHVARLTKLDAEVLEAHMLRSVVGHRPRARCCCGREFAAPEADPLNGDAAVELWAAHVEEVAG